MTRSTVWWFPRASARSRHRIGRRRLRDPIQDLLAPADHPELLARDPLLQHGVGLQTVLVALQRVDEALHGVDGRGEPRLALALADEITRAVLAALHREHERREHAGGDEDSGESHTAAGFLSCRHYGTLHPIDRAAGILRGAAEL